MSMQTRRDELAANVAEVRARIDAAVRAASRPAGSVTLVAVTKTYPVDDIRVLSELGVTHVGESRVQEAGAKFDELGATAHTLRWHLIGQLQRNKVNAAAKWADVIESVDRLELVAAIGRAADSRPHGLDVLLQINVADDPQPGRGGATPDEVERLAAAVIAERTLTLAGVMAVAPLEVEPERAFARLAQVHDSLLANYPWATTRSAGMSGDLEAAVAAGATHVRIGTAILGTRPAVGYGA